MIPDNLVSFDFETEGIEGRPSYPPKPVGVSIKIKNGPSHYYAFGHSTENNCTEDEARGTLHTLIYGGYPILAHNMKFDIDVANHHWDIPIPPWQQMHDSQYAVYLYDVHARQFALKPSAERILGEPPEEQDRLKEWILRNVPGASASKKSDRYWAQYICLAPGGLVGEYAQGDTDRSYGLFKHCMAHIHEQGMVEAYDRERELMPYMLRAEQRGIRLDMERAEGDLPMYEQAFDRATSMIIEYLGVREFNVDSGAELAQALLSSGSVKDLPKTPTGKMSTAKKALQSAITDSHLLALLGYRGALKTCLGTFMRPWLAQARANGGRIHTQWHQTRGDKDSGGTVTGRMSSTGPNFQNIPNDFDGLNVPNMPPLPHMREYVLPEPGHLWLKRDYSAQEVRILGHFEDGGLMQAFQRNPKMDPHQYAADIIRERTGFDYDRKFIKAIVFGILYGQGTQGVADGLKVDYATAAQVKSLYLGTFPDVQALMRDIKRIGSQGRAVRTVGSRILYSEPPKGGRKFDYKLLNHLVQGSAADVTKQGIINYMSHSDSTHGFRATVHDEINLSVPREVVEEQALLLRDCMADVNMDVPLTSDCYIGENWHDADNHKRKDLC